MGQQTTQHRHKAKIMAIQLNLRNTGNEILEHTSLSPELTNYLKISKNFREFSKR